MGEDEEPGDAGDERDEDAPEAGEEEAADDRLRSRGIVAQKEAGAVGISKGLSAAAMTPHDEAPPLLRNAPQLPGTWLQKRPRHQLLCPRQKRHRNLRLRLVSIC